MNLTELKLPQLHTNMNCPQCYSNNIARHFFISTLPVLLENKKPYDSCKSCGFISREYSFIILNEINKREDKINKILDK